jgi:hypothetical protein
MMTLLARLDVWLFSYGHEKEEWRKVRKSEIHKRVTAKVRQERFTSDNQLETMKILADFEEKRYKEDVKKLEELMKEVQNVAEVNIEEMIDKVVQQNQEENKRAE